MPKSRLCPIIIVLGFTAMTSSQAQHMNEPDSPCAKTLVTVELVGCLDKARALSDSELNATYGDVRKRLDANEAKQLVVAQRLWIQYRDANCMAERDLYGSGTGSRPAYLACLDSMTRQRTKELRVTYALRVK